MEPKEIQTSSCEVETKLKCRINIDIQNIENKYTIEENAPYLLSRHYFNMKFKNGLSLKCRINLSDQRNNKWIHLVICDKKFNVKDLVSKYELLVNGTISKNGSEKGQTWRFNNNDFDSYGLFIKPSFTGKFTSIKGFFEIEFKPSTQIERKQELKNLLYKDTFGSHNKNPDFTILCQDKSFQFNKRNLCFVSKVFQKMIESSYTQESKSDKVEIIDFNPEVVEAFNRVMFQNDESLDENDLTVELLMFANKYCVLTLVKFLTNHLSESLTMHNIYPVIIGAYLTDNDELLKKALKFIQNNNGQFQDNEDWKEFQKSHPQCFVKMMGFLMFQK